MSPRTMIVMNEKKDVKPILLKFGMALALSFAGFIFSRFRNRRMKRTRRLPPPRSSDHGCKAVLEAGRVQRNDDFATRKLSSCCSTVKENHDDNCIEKMTVDTSPDGLPPDSRHGEEKDGLLLPEFNDLVKDLDFGATNAWKFSKENVDNEKEIWKLKNMIRILEERERNHEIQLLEYYGLKEQEAAASELKNRIQIANMEAKMLCLKIQSLQSENRRLESQVANHAKTVSELESAKSKLKVFKQKLRHEAQQSKKQILKLQEKMTKLQEQDINAAAREKDMQAKSQLLKDLECEAQDLRESCLRLQEENSDLARKLESTQILASSVLEDREAYAWKQESERLRQENESLAQEIEQLQSDRYSDLEELVYLRWINACLRYELRNYQPDDGKTIARDLSRTLSPESEKRAKQLIREYAIAEGLEGKGLSVLDFDSDWWSSSQASGDRDDSSTDFSGGTKASFSSKAKIFSKLRKLAQGKDDNSVSRRGRMRSLEDVSSLCSTSKATYPVVENHKAESTTPLKTPSGTYSDYRVVKNLKEGVKEQDTGIGSSYRKITNMSRGGAFDFRDSRRRRSSDFWKSLDLSSHSSVKSELVKYAEV